MVKSNISPIPTISNFNIWLINYKSNRHMSDYFKDFLTYVSCTKWKNIRIADGSCTPIFETSSINYISTIMLSLVLHMPSFPNSLLSISALIRDLNYKIKFFF